MLLTVVGSVVVGAVDRAVRQDLQMAVLDVHLDLSGRAGDVRQIGRSFRPDAGVARQIDRRGTHCTDNSPDGQHTETGGGARPRTVAMIVEARTQRLAKPALPERDEEQQQRQLNVRGTSAAAENARARASSPLLPRQGLERKGVASGPPAAIAAPPRDLGDARLATTTRARVLHFLAGCSFLGQGREARARRGRGDQGILLAIGIVRLTSEPR